MNNKIYIHYGANEFIPEVFAPIKNMSFFSKPYGGLWASDINAKYGWINWMTENDYLGRKNYMENWFKFKLTDVANVLTITNVSQLNSLPHREDADILVGNKPFACWQLLDFEKIAEKYDAIEVIISSDWKLYQELYGWDCDSILILNKGVIVELQNK